MPDIFQTEFEQELRSLTLANPDIKIVFPKTPHITLCYLKAAAQFDLITISELISPLIQNLAGFTLEIGEISFFNGKSNQVLFLDVQYPPELKQVQQLLTQNLADYTSEENKLPFHPHLTVGRISADKSTLKGVKSKNKNWRFEITQVYIYGVDSTVTPEFQEKLIGVEIQ